MPLKIKEQYYRDRYLTINQGLRGENKKESQDNQTSSRTKFVKRAPKKCTAATCSKFLSPSASQQAPTSDPSHSSTPDLSKQTSWQAYTRPYSKQKQHTPLLMPADINSYTSQAECVPCSDRSRAPSLEANPQQELFDFEASVTNPVYASSENLDSRLFNFSHEFSILFPSTAPPIRSMSPIIPPPNESLPRGVDAHGHTALHRAAIHGHESVLAVLLQAGADPTLPDSTGLTPLHLATKTGHIRGVQLLLSGVSQPWNIIRQATYTGETALHLAVQARQSRMVRLLLEHSARAINFQDWLGRTALHMACESNQHDIVDMLVQAGAKLDIRDFEGQSLLHSVCMGGSV